MSSGRKGVNLEYALIMARARHTNRQRDCTDKLSGEPIARDGGPGVYLAAAISAVETGLMAREWDSVAEGLAMLMDLRTAYSAALGPRPKRSKVSV